MDYSNFFNDTVDRIRYVYFKINATAVFLWIKNIGSQIVPDGLRQEIRNYEDYDLSGESLNIDIIGKNKMIIRVGCDNNMIVWEVWVCS